MLSRTHGQPATPTTLGKELANVVGQRRDAPSLKQFARARLLRQDQRCCRQLQRPRGGLSRTSTGRRRWRAASCRIATRITTPLTTQIEPHDAHSPRCLTSLARVNTILIDLDRDVEGYTSRWVISMQRPVAEAKSARRPCRTRSTRSTSRTQRGTSAWRMPCCATLPTSCLSRAGAICRTRPCCATSVSPSATLLGVVSCAQDFPGSTSIRLDLAPISTTTGRCLPSPSRR